MLKKTKYRIVLYKETKYLLYKKDYKIWFFRWSKWVTIKYPNSIGKSKIISNQIPEYKNLNRFMIKFVNVEEYFKTEYNERKKLFK